MRARTSALAPTLALAALVAACAEDAPRRLNVLLVTLDTTRADYLGCYGAPQEPTPNLDALADEGVLFEHAVSTSAVTPVSHASILTGLDPYRHGLRVLSAASGYRLPDEARTLTTILAERGWSTLAVHSAFPVSGHFGFDRGFESFDGFDDALRTTGDEHRWNVKKHQRRSDATTDLAIERLEGAADPFFLWVHYWDPHDFHELPPDDFLARFGDPELMSRGSKARYAAEVSYVDRELGRLLQHLRDAGRYEDTLVVVVSDHGEGLGDHDWPSHRILYQEQMRVPLILRVPDGPHGRRIGELASAVDILPTVLDVLGLDADLDLSGTSLLPLAAGEPAPARTAYADQINGYDLNARKLEKSRPQADFLYCLNDGRWKLIYRPNHPGFSELYDLERDSAETANLWDEAPEERDRLLRELTQRAGWVTRPFEPDGASAEELERAREALAQLGYAGDVADEPREGIPWAWTCVDHRDVLQDAQAPCPTCGAPPLLTRRP